MFQNLIIPTTQPVPPLSCFNLCSECSGLSLPIQRPSHHGVVQVLSHVMRVVGSHLDKHNVNWTHHSLWRQSYVSYVYIVHFPGSKGNIRNILKAPKTSHLALDSTLYKRSSQSGHGTFVDMASNADELDCRGQWVVLIPETSNWTQAVWFPVLAPCPQSMSFRILQTCVSQSRNA